MDKAIALANNDTVFLSWVYDQQIANCLGFAVYRKDASGTRTALPAWVGFKGGSNPNWQPRDTGVWPVQKFSWRDFAATPGHTYSYDVVPMVGTPDSLSPVPDKTLTTGTVSLTPNVGDVSAYFNRGLLSTQAMTHAVPQGPGGGPNPTVLKDRIDQPGDPLRLKLAGQILDALTSLLDRSAKEGGSCYLALYELNDPDLIQRLLAAKGRIHLILSNTGTDDAENKPARQTLHEAGIDIIDRMVANGHIGHNKFCLYVDANDTPQAVLTGSTNWSYTGLCTQSNNALIINSQQVAQAYLDYWNRLKADGHAQGQPLRTADRQQPASATINGAQAKIWFSPNTQQPNKTPTSALPVDMADVFSAMAQAKEAIVFLVFQPGTPSIIEYAAAVENVKPGLLVYGAATDPGATNAFNTILVHRTTKDIVTVSDQVVSASALKTPFDYWQKELLALPGAHAIIHDKIVVIDPMSPDCVVITGSHNLGYRASYNNDENLVIIRGHQPLARAYATHVMDVYDHYRWRFLTQKSGKSSFTGLDPTPGWQAKYFAQGSTARREALFWTGQSAPLPDAPAPPVPTKSAPAKQSSQRQTKSISASAPKRSRSKQTSGRKPRKTS